MFIKEIKIRNFRSINKAEIPLNNISVFVGFNDAGKSNILKSLNLFFNGETDYGKPLDFIQDYCKYTTKRKKKADEIIIELIISAPKNYKGAKDIKWSKTWRKNGFLDESIAFIDGRIFPKKSKLYSWMQNIRYTYVPAIRGNTYFQILLAKLHDTLAETVEGELRTAGDDFIDKIKFNTEEMSNEIFARIGMKSQIIFPTNLQTLFKTLDFSTADGIFDISLSNRGDGIKTRHIPAILKFISEQLNINKVKGSPNVSVIWGYEEPENNLEMYASFKLAEQFIDYSKDIQLVITTHSPGFYSLKEKYKTTINLFKVSKFIEEESQISSLETHSILDNDMGLMPLITPYIEEKIIEIEKLKIDNEKFKIEIESINKNVIFVEGDDEVRVFNALVSVFDLADSVIVKREGCGCGGVKNSLMSWSWVSGSTALKSIGLFDNDSSGSKEFNKLKEEPQYKDALSKGKVKAVIYKVPLHLRNIKNKIHNYPIELEEMYPIKVWKHAQSKGWLEERDISELREYIKIDTINQSIKEKILSLNFDQIELMYILMKVPDKHKEKLSKFIIQLKDGQLFNDRICTLKEIFLNEILPFLKNI